MVQTENNFFLWLFLPKVLEMKRWVDEVKRVEDEKRVLRIITTQILDKELRTYLEKWLGYRNYPGKIHKKYRINYD